MEQSSFVVNEEPSVFPHSEFNPGNQDERELQEEYEDENDRARKGGNVLPFCGNQQTMNLNPLILTNIRNSPYSKVNLVELRNRKVKILKLDEILAIFSDFQAS